MSTADMLDSTARAIVFFFNMQEFRIGGWRRAASGAPVSGSGNKGINGDAGFGKAGA